MGRQPYMPLYVGDYIKDTRVLPLNVRGAWVDLILFMWDNPVRGELVGTIEEVARLIGCGIDEALFALDLLKQKRTADIDLLPTGEFKIVSRRMKRDAEISKIRSEVGKNGVKAKKEKEFASAKGQAKAKQKPEYDNEDDTDIEFKLKGALDEIYIEQQRMKWAHVNFDLELNSFREKVRGSPGHYANHDTGGIRLAFQSQLRNAKNKTNGQHSKNGKQSSGDLATAFANRVVQDAKEQQFRGNGEASAPDD